MKEIDPQKKIILDADVIIHFVKGGLIGVLPRIYSNKMFVVDVVYNESLSRKYQTEIRNMFNYKLVQELEIKNDINVFVEYNRLQKRYGKGESVCMAYCRYHDDVIGSSNLRDITSYCEQYGIVYLTTMDFLLAALEREILTEAEIDRFIYIVKSSGSRLPCNSVSEYKNRFSD